MFFSRPPTPRSHLISPVRALHLPAPWVRRPALLGLLLLLLAGCGSAPTSASTSPAAAPTATEPQPTATTAGADFGTPVPGTAVIIEDFDFSPAALAVKTGATVTWTDAKGGTHHTVTSDSGLFHSGMLAPSASFTFTFTQPGTYTYHCSVHPSMTAEIVVTS